MKKSSLILIVATLCVSLLSWSEEAAPVESPVSSNPKISILPSTDSSSYGLGPALQTALSTLYQGTGKYEPVMSTEPLGGFTPLEISRAFKEKMTEMMSFVLIEDQRLSIFLFHRDHPVEFIVSSKELTTDLVRQLGSPYIEAKFTEAFTEVAQAEQQNSYQSLPSLESKPIASGAPRKRKDERVVAETRILFREFASLSDSHTYVGATIGFSRFGRDGNSASNVTFGANLGHQIDPRWSVEGGLSASSYLMGYLGGRYSLPFAEEIVRFSAGFDITRVLSTITQNPGFGPPDLVANPLRLDVGSVYLGPGIFFEIPLLGAAIRGDLRMYVGSGTIFTGSYGFVYYL